MNFAGLNKWISTHHNEALGGGAVAAVGAFALYQRHKAAAATSGDAGGITGTDPTTGYAYGTAGLTGSPDTSGTDLQNAFQDQLNQAIDAINTAIGGIPTSDTGTSTSGTSSTGTSSTGTSSSAPSTSTPKASTSKYTLPSQIAKYVIEFDKSSNTYYDVTSAGTVHKLTPSQLAADLKAGATSVTVGSRPLPAAAPKPKPKPAPPKAKPTPPKSKGDAPRKFS